MASELRYVQSVTGEGFTVGEQGVVSIRRLIPNIAQHSMTCQVTTSDGMVLVNCSLIEYVNKE